MPPAERNPDAAVISNLDELPVLLAPGDLARLLRRSPRTIRRWDRLGKIPSRLLGTWRRDEIKAWLEAGRPPRAAWEQHRSQRFRRDKPRRQRVAT